MRFLVVCVFMLAGSNLLAQQTDSDKTLSQISNQNNSELKIANAGETLGSEGASPAASDITYLICKNKKMVRTLRVLKKNNGGCAATYTKEGVDQVVGNSWAVERCTRIINGIKETLEKAEWKCKDISEARVSSFEAN